MNWIVIIGAALIPLAIGFVWYGPLFGKSWIVESGVDVEAAKKQNMAMTFGFTFLFSIMLAILLQMLVIHQLHLNSIVMNEPGFNDPNSEVSQLLNTFKSKYGQNFRTFKHGAFHGALSGIFLAIPIMGINALFEMRSWKYIFLNVGYWVVCMCLMGGIICQWG